MLSTDFDLSICFTILDFHRLHTCQSLCKFDSLPNVNENKYFQSHVKSLKNKPAHPENLQSQCLQLAEKQFQDPPVGLGSIKMHV